MDRFSNPGSIAQLMNRSAFHAKGDVLNDIQSNVFGHPQLGQKYHSKVKSYEGDSQMASQDNLMTLSGRFIVLQSSLLM
jgi:hypothetical protein